MIVSPPGPQGHVRRSLAVAVVTAALAVGCGSPAGVEATPAPDLAAELAAFDPATARTAEEFMTIEPPGGLDHSDWVVGPHGVAVRFSDRSDDRSGAAHRIDYHPFDGGPPTTLVEWPGNDRDEQFYVRGVGDRLALLEFSVGDEQRWTLELVDLRSAERTPVARSDDLSDAKPPLAATMSGERIVWAMRDRSDDICLFSSAIEPIEAERVVCAGELGLSILTRPWIGEESLQFVATDELGHGTGFEMPWAGGPPREVVDREGTMGIAKVADAYVTYWINPDPLPERGGQTGVFFYRGGREVRVEPPSSISPVVCGRWAVWVGRGDDDTVQGFDPSTGEHLVVAMTPDIEGPSFITCSETAVAIVDRTDDKVVRLYRLPS